MTFRPGRASGSTLMSAPFSTLPRPRSNRRGGMGLTGLFISTWGGSGGSFVFTASSVPEPSTFTLLAIGSVGLSLRMAAAEPDCVGSMI